MSLQNLYGYKEANIPISGLLSIDFFGVSCLHFLPFTLNLLVVTLYTLGILKNNKQRKRMKIDKNRVTRIFIINFSIFISILSSISTWHTFESLQESKMLLENITFCDEICQFESSTATQIYDILGTLIHLKYVLLVVIIVLCLLPSISVLLSNKIIMMTSYQNVISCFYTNTFHQYIDKLLFLTAY
mgnify:CR=1 FL=1